MVKYLVNEIMPLIWQGRPEVPTYCGGQGSSPEVKKMEETRISRLRVPFQIYGLFFWKSTIAVAPLVYGAGVQITNPGGNGSWSIPW